jgi:hypothetical protein
MSVPAQMFSNSAGFERQIAYEKGHSRLIPGLQMRACLLQRPAAASTRVEIRRSNPRIFLEDVAPESARHYFVVVWLLQSCRVPCLSAAESDHR